jgi:hypothetical protein
MTEVPPPSEDTSAAGPRYEQRYCAFVDVLGFTELLKKFGTHDKYTELRNILFAIHSPRASPFEKPFAGSDLRAQSISDAVCISTAASAPGLLHLMSALQFSTLDVLSEGVLVRGAVVKDYLYHAPGIVFGQALVRAYLLESKIVKYPRVMLTSDVVKDSETYAANAPYTEAFKGRVTQADDGPYFLDYFWEIRGIMERGDMNGGEILDRYQAMAYLIQDNLREAFDVPAYFEKWQWIANYWNRTAAALGLIPIEGPGIVPPKEPGQTA